MNILVCLSRVPDSNTKLNFTESTNNINDINIKYVLNPYDEYALEEALQIKAKFGGNITALTVGSDESKEVLRSAYALGIDKAVLIKAEPSELLSMNVAEALSEYAQTQSFDIILLGKQSIDYSSEAIPIFMSEMLNVPVITTALKIEINDAILRVNKELEDGYITLETSMPCIISVQKGINQPRYPKLPDIIKSKNKSIAEYNANVKESNFKTLKIQTNQKPRLGKIVGDSKEEINEIINLIKNDAKVI